MTTVGWPLKSNIIRGANRLEKIHNTFGYVRRYPDGQPKGHQGWDFSADIGTECFAIADGVIKLIYSSGAYGKVLVQSFLWEGQTYFAAYAHLSETRLATGTPVKRGDLLCLTGESGNARGLPRSERHLHFEIRDVARPGPGLAHRFSPLIVFGVVPLDRPILMTAAVA